MTVQSFTPGGNPLANLWNQEGSGTTSERVITMDGRETITLDSLIGLGDAEALLGWVVVSTDDTDLAVEASFVIFEDSEMIGRASVPGVLPRLGWCFEGHQEASGVGTKRTGIAILNPPDSGRDAEVRIQPPIGDPIKITLKPGTSVVKFLDELAPGLPDFWGKVCVTSDVEVAVTLLIQEGKVITTLKTFPPPSAVSEGTSVVAGAAPPKVSYIAQHARGFAGERFFLTIINAFNTSTEEIHDVTLRSFDESGDPAPLLSDGGVADSSTTRPIFGRNGARQFFSRNGTSEELGIGWVRVEGDVAVQAVFRIEKSGLLETRAGIDGKTPQDSAMFFAENQQGVRTGVALLLPHDAQGAADVTIEPIDGDGDSIGDLIELTIQPGTKVAKFLDELAVGLPDFLGRVDIRSTVPIVVVPLLQAGVILTSRETFLLP